MIAKIGKGQNVSGLVSYLFDPGRHEEHAGQRSATAEHLGQVPPGNPRAV